LNMKVSTQPPHQIGEFHQVLPVTSIAILQVTGDYQ